MSNTHDIVETHNQRINPSPSNIYDPARGGRLFMANDNLPESLRPLMKHDVERIAIKYGLDFFAVAGRCKKSDREPFIDALHRAMQQNRDIMVEIVWRATRMERKAVAALSDGDLVFAAFRAVRNSSPTQARQLQLWRAFHTALRRMIGLKTGAGSW